MNWIGKSKKNINLFSISFDFFLVGYLISLKKDSKLNRKGGKLHNKSTQYWLISINFFPRSIKRKKMITLKNPKTIPLKKEQIAIKFLYLKFAYINKRAYKVITLNYESRIAIDNFWKT